MSLGHAGSCDLVVLWRHFSLGPMERTVTVLARRDNAAITNKKKTEVLASTFVMICNNSLSGEKRKVRHRERKSEGAVRENTLAVGRKKTLKMSLSTCKCLNSTRKTAS